jgi:hypothetical protein
MRIPSLNRSVVAPLTSAIITVLIAGLVVAGICWSRRSISA